MTRGTVVWIFALMLLLSCFPKPGKSKYAHGSRRSGKKLVGPSVTEERHVNSFLHCLLFCEGLDTCKAINFNRVSASNNCQLFEEGGCLSHQLISDPDVNYYDVYEEPTIERLLPFWEDPVCAQDGYCSAYCIAQNRGDACFGDGHCSSTNMVPPGAYACREGTCQPADGFWEARPGLALPHWMDWILLPWVKGYKKLKAGTCSLVFYLKLGAGATVELSLTGTQRDTQTRLKFRIGLTSTDLLFYNEEPHGYDDVYYQDKEGDEIPIVSGADTTGMVNTETESLLKISWCDGTMSIGPNDNPTLVTGQTSQAGEVGEIVYLAGTSSGPESYLKTAQSVADPWLFDEEGTDTDPVFSFGDTMIARRIEASVDVTVKYDCKADHYCNVFLRSAYPHMLTIYVGGWKNKACGIAYNDSRHGPWLMKHETGPVLSITEFNTFNVRYNDGAVTVFRNDVAEPIYDITAPHKLPPITSVGIGSMFWGSWKSVRVARYDPAWRTDTWKTDGIGFSNMDGNLL